MSFTAATTLPNGYQNLQNRQTQTRLRRNLRTCKISMASSTISTQDIGSRFWTTLRKSASIWPKLNRGNLAQIHMRMRFKVMLIFSSEWMLRCLCRTSCLPCQCGRSVMRYCQVTSRCHSLYLRSCIQISFKEKCGV